MVGKTAARHTSAEFVAFLADIVVNQPATKEIHVIADNLSAQKTKQVTEFLDRYPTVHLHFTPTYSSWLNQVELWFAKIERDLIARGVFTSALTHGESPCGTSASTTRLQNHKVALPRPDTSHHSRHTRYSPLVILVDNWHAFIGDPAYAAAVLDCLEHNAYRIDLTSESLRRRRSRSIPKD